MKISIITVCFNSEATIRDTLESVKKQDYLDIEYVIIDGGSTDNTLNIINDYGEIITKLISEPDNGLYDALNKGLVNVTGDIIGFLHSDDFFSSITIISQLASKINYDNLDGVYGDLQYANKEDTNKIIRLWKSSEFKLELLKKGWMPAHPTLFLKKCVYDKHGEFNTSYKISADYDFMLRVLKDNTFKFGYLEKVITKMRVGGASNRSIKNIINKSREDYHAIRSNNIGGVITLLLKNTSKIKQFLIK
jgi:glycosyltransferase involved in cell wall biosynthesis